MDSSGMKVYGAFQIDVDLQNKYFGPGVIFASVGASVANLMAEMFAAFFTGRVQGSTVTDFSVGPNISHLLVMNNFVQQITTVDMDAAAVKEVEKWKNKDPDAFDSSNAVGILKELKGNGDESEDEEEDLRGKLKPLWVDYYKGIDSLPLAKADIVTSICFLDAISKDHDECRGNLRQLSNRLKCGGYALICSCLNCTYFKVGPIKYHYLKCNESFYRGLMSEEGFDIKYLKKLDKEMSSDSVDNEGMVFIIAQKVKEAS